MITLDTKFRFYNIFRFILAVLLATSFIAFNNTNLSSIAVIVIIAVLFGIYLIENGWKVDIYPTVFHILVLVFAIFCFCSSMWAVSSSSKSIQSGITIIEILICMTIVFFSYQKSDSIDSLFKSIMWSGVVVAIYSIAYYGASEFSSMLQTSSRIENTYANANTVGMWMALTIVICVYCIFNEGWKWRYLLFAFPIELLAMAQSRTAIIEAILGIIAVLLVRYIDRKNVLRALLQIVFIIFIVVIAVYFISKIEIFSGINERMEDLWSTIIGESEVDNSAKMRSLYAKAGLETFLDNPILGIGIGNSGAVTEIVSGKHTYLHNNYAEMLACGGIVGFISFYSIYAYFIVMLIKQLINHVKYSDICLILLLILLAADVGTVSYYNKGVYLVFTLCALQIFINGNTKEEDEDIDKV